MIRKLPTTILGTGYELHCLRLLEEQMRLSLTRVGGRGDGGVDLRGWWNLTDTTLDASLTDSTQRKIRVLAQCKAEKIRPGPRLVREMEGVARREHDFGKESRTGGTGLPAESIVALLCSRSGFSPAAVLEANRSRIPTLLLHIPFDYEQELMSQHDPTTQAIDHELLDSMPRTLRGAFWNASMMGTRGVLGSEWELRKEFVRGGSDFRIAVHCNGRPI